MIAFVAPSSRQPEGAGIWLASYDSREPPVFLTEGDFPNWSPLQDKIVYVLGNNLMVANPNPENPDPQLITQRAGQRPRHEPGLDARTRRTPAAGSRTRAR